MHDLPLLTLMAAAFTSAWILGLLAHRLRLSPIVGYLVAGIVIGPYTPGFVGDRALAPQVAEIGVILLMFGVGLHFHLADLLAVKKLVLPGATGQSLLTTLLGAAVALSFGWAATASVVLGIALAVASTVVLLRVLDENQLLDTPAGHGAIGWLIVEDVLTVVVLVILPAIGSASGHDPAAQASPIWQTLLWAMLKLGALIAILQLAGSRVVPWIMVRVARLRSRELFTLTVLVMALAIAVGSAYLFGASMALGAFLAGMVVGQSPVSQQAAADALPLRDAFAVLFFASVGMLFDPHLLVRQPMLLASCLAVVIVAKPLIAGTLVALLGFPPRTAVVIALGMAQIGEFSFILAEAGADHHLLGPDALSVLVACAIISITLNPILFSQLDRIERWLRARPRLWAYLDRKTIARQTELNAGFVESLQKVNEPLGVVVGFGPVGQSARQLLQDNGLSTVVIDLNPDAVERLKKAGSLAIFGDASQIEVIADSVARATHLILTLPHVANRATIIAAAKLINPAIRVLVRAHYLAERDALIGAGADAVIFEEAEAAVALSRLMMIDLKVDPVAIETSIARMREMFPVAVAPRGI